MYTALTAGELLNAYRHEGGRDDKVLSQLSKLEQSPKDDKIISTLHGMCASQAPKNGQTVTKEVVRLVNLRNRLVRNWNGA